MKSNAERQRDYRARLLDKAATFDEMWVKWQHGAAALEQILTKLDGNTKPLAIELRTIALRGLGREQP